VRPAVNASHQGRNLSAGLANFLMTALACDLAAEEEPMKIVVASFFPGPTATTVIFC
jgi:hypothetical protein